MATGWLEYAAAYDGRPNSVVGEVLVLPAVDSPSLGRRLDLLVYLPPSYHQDRRTYPVLFMQDGQNLFDRFTSYAGEWQVDEIMESLATEEGLEAIVVGVPNGGVARLDEYGPWPDGVHGGGRAREYLHFLAEVLSPLIDASFRTTRSPEDTALVGSSMGGLFSLWAFFECPEVFGRCAALSPSVQFAHGAALRDLRHRDHRGGKIYLDVGTVEGPTPRWSKLLFGLQPRPYLRAVREARDLLTDCGYRRGVDLLYVEEAGGQHNEEAWGRRLPGALRFLLR